MARLFGGRTPFDDPFFTQPFGGFVGGSPFDDPFFSSPFSDQPCPGKQITIEELDQYDDDDDGAKTSDTGKEMVVKKPDRSAGSGSAFHFRRVAYGGLDGMHYSCSEGRMASDGVFLAEMKEEDNLVGEMLHTVSKGIHNKGHSLTTKRGSDGRMGSMQTLHNLNEDELSGFEENWKSNADKQLPGWCDGFNLLENTAGTNWIGWDGLPTWNGWGGLALPLFENSGNSGAVVPNSEEKPKKVVRVNVE